MFERHSNKLDPGSQVWEVKLPRVRRCSVASRPSSVVAGTAYWHVDRLWTLLLPTGSFVPTACGLCLLDRIDRVDKLKRFHRGGREYLYAGRVITPEGGCR